jgi:hypothetical protein
MDEKLIAHLASLTTIVSAIVAIFFAAYKRFILNPPDRETYDEVIESKIKEILENYSSQLLYIAFYHYTDRRPPIIWQDRLFDESSIRYLTFLTPEKAARGYKPFIRKLFRYIKTLNKNFRPLHQGSLKRVIFDVEHGGLFYHKVSETEYLFGVCLNQSEMAKADQEMSEIVKQLKIYFGLKQEEKSSLEHRP